MGPQLPMRNPCERERVWLAFATNHAGAVQVNIAIMRVFVRVRTLLASHQAQGTSPQLTRVVPLCLARRLPA